MHCHFILLNPVRGENVGFAARALKTMGFSSLRIVGEALQDVPSARKTGYGAHDVLDEATTFRSLPEALTDLDLTIGTTSKKRIKRYDYHTPGQISKLLNSKRGTMKNVGLLFGSEENGLTTEELEYCDLLSSIPMATSYPSLNLAQSVLLYAWELYKVDIQIIQDSTDNPELQGLLKEEIQQLLNHLEIDSKPLLHQRIMDRVMLLSSDDMELLMAVFSKMRKFGKF